MKEFSLWKWLNTLCRSYCLHCWVTTEARTREDLVNIVLETSKTAKHQSNLEKGTWQQDRPRHGLMDVVYTFTDSSSGALGHTLDLSYRVFNQHHKLTQCININGLKEQKRKNGLVYSVWTLSTLTRPPRYTIYYNISDIHHHAVHLVLVVWNSIKAQCVGVPSLIN